MCEVVHAVSCHLLKEHVSTWTGVLTLIIIIIIITRLMTHVKVIHRVKNRKCGWSRINEGKLGCKVQSLPVVFARQERSLDQRDINLLTYLLIF